MENRLNAPFVALLAAIVGLLVGGLFVAAVPPLRSVATYHVSTQATVVPTAIDGCHSILNPAANWSCETVVVAMCNLGDQVAGGGYGWYLGKDNSGYNYTLHTDIMSSVGIVYSKAVKNATGGEGWTAMAVSHGSWTDSVTGQLMPLLIVTAICPHTT